MKRNVQLNILNSTKAIAAAFVVALALTGCGGNDMLGSPMSRTATTRQDNTRNDAQTGGYCPVIMPVLSAGVYSGSLVIDGTGETRHLMLWLSNSDKGLTGTLMAESGSEQATIDIEALVDDESAMIKPLSKPEGNNKPLLEAFGDQMTISLSRTATEGEITGFWLQSRHRAVVGEVTLTLMRNPIR